jgi:hypothetical protein
MATSVLPIAKPTCLDARDTMCDTLISRSSMSGERSACCRSSFSTIVAGRDRLACLEQQIHEHAIPAVGRHAARDVWG